MSIAELFTGAFIGVLQILILTVCGIILSKLPALDSIGENRLTSVVYYLFLPVYCFIAISGSINIAQEGVKIGLLVLSFTCSTIISGILGFLYSKVSKVDIRVMWSATIMSTYGSVTAFPSLLANALCEDGGLLENDKNCVNVEGYALIGLLMLNIYVWAIAPVLIARDKFLCYHIRRKMCLVKEFYPSIEEFLKDKELEHINAVQQEKHRDLLSTADSEHDILQKDKFFLDSPVDIPQESLNDESLIEYSLQMNISSQDYQEFRTHFESFISKINSKVFDKLISKMPHPIKPLPTSISYLVSQLIRPPIIACILGIIFGSVFTLRNAIFNTWSKKLFIKTLTNVSSGAVPTLVLLLGAKLSKGFGFTTNVNLRIKDVIAMNIIRLIITPLCGYLFMFIIQSLIDQEDKDYVLEFVMYIFWNVPASLLMISTFVLIGYYSTEIGIVMFWSNAVSVITMPLFNIIYFMIFPVD